MKTIYEKYKRKALTYNTQKNCREHREEIFDSSTGEIHSLYVRLMPSLELTVSLRINRTQKCINRTVFLLEWVMRKGDDAEFLDFGITDERTSNILIEKMKGFKATLEFDNSYQEVVRLYKPNHLQACHYLFHKLKTELPLSKEIMQIIDDISGCNMFCTFLSKNRNLFFSGYMRRDNSVIPVQNQDIVDVIENYTVIKHNGV